jgi:ferrochelatase
MLKSLAESGVKNLLVIPLSFVSDHIETLHEIDIEYSKKAWELGIAKFERMPSLNSSPTFIAALANKVRTANGE